MCDECEYCGAPAWRAELRVARDADLGGALVLICHDCHDDGQCVGDECGWHSLMTQDELADAIQAAADDRAHAMNDRRAGL